MATFNYGNLLTSVQKKMFSNTGEAAYISQRLDNMALFSGKTAASASMFNTSSYDFLTKASNIVKMSGNAEDIAENAKSYGMDIQMKTADTAYSSGINGEQKISVYTFTDKYGNTVEINNANKDEFIQHEQKAVDNIIQGVLDEVLSGSISLPQDAADTNEDALAA